MHPIHHTEAFVLGHRNTGEANRTVILYTNLFGLIRGIAQGIRKAESKLKFSLQDYSFGTVDLVRGKEVWRITNAEKKGGVQFANNRALLPVLTRISRLVTKLCTGEEENEMLFEALRSLYMVINESHTTETLTVLESIIVLRILFALGYVDEESDIKDYLTDQLSLSYLKEHISDTSMIIRHINRSLKETHF